MGDFIVGQFQGLRASDRTVEFDSESGPVILQHREFFLDVVTLNLGLQPALAGSFKVVKRGTKISERCFQSCWSTHSFVPEVSLGASWGSPSTSQHVTTHSKFAWHNPALGGITAEFLATFLHTATQS